MEKVLSAPSHGEAAGWLVGGAICAIAVPALLIATATGGDRTALVVMFTSIFLAEFLAPAVGMGLGLDPFRAIVMTVSVTFGICMLITGVLCFVGASSKKVAKFLASVQKKMEKYPKFMRYGPAANFIFIIMLGMYIAPGVSFLVGWSRARSAAFMLAGIAFVTTLIAAATMGIIRLFFA